MSECEIAHLAYQVAFVRADLGIPLLTDLWPQEPWLLEIAAERVAYLDECEWWYEAGEPDGRILRRRTE